MKILVAGDFGSGERVIKSSLTDQRKSILYSISEIVNSCDYSIVNLEAPLKGGGKPINKRGPHIYSNIYTLQILKECGFNCCTLANNHIRDWGNNGIKQTIEELKKQNLDYVGAGQNIEEARKILYIRKGDYNVALINVCESEFSIAENNQAGAAPLNEIDVYYKLKEAQSKAETIIVIVHGGHEGYQLPSPRMKHTYRFFIDAGADVVINHHQHCYSGYEVYHNKPILYGLGNFCFDRSNYRNGLWNEGYMVELNIENENIDFNLYPFIQCNEKPIVRLMSKEEKLSFEKNINELNKIIKDDDLLSSRYSQYIKEKYNNNIRDFSPFNSKLFRGLIRKGLFPDCISLKKALLLYDRISCESHKDITLGILKMKINKSK